MIVDDLLGGHLGEDLAQRLVAVHGDVLVDVLGVDDAAVPQRHPVLLGVELGLVQGLDVVGVLVHGLLVEQALDDAALEQVLADDFGNVLGLHLQNRSSPRDRRS